MLKHVYRIIDLKIKNVGRGLTVAEPVLKCKIKLLKCCTTNFEML